ncbi:hypothetical protein JOS77_04805 [Chromobacterium haemolyticum]|nr:hypothetical protein JOS77_04805 [Chromobacterium haemolyticum]
MLVGLNKRKPEVFDVYRVNLKTGKLTLEAKNPGNVTSWSTDHNGRIRIATTTDGVNSTLLYRDQPGGAFRKLMTTSFRDSFNPLFFTFDNQRFYAASNLGRDKSAIVEFDPKTGKEVKQIYHRDDVDVDGLGFSRKRKVITCARFETDKPGRQCLDEKSEALLARLRRGCPATRWISSPPTARRTASSWRPGTTVPRASAICTTRPATNWNCWPRSRPG